uniref:DUF1858 domain-containing protein n=1 Tax=candidate division CPR3 bacterium TaxID=2268181 RepID=A0A7C5YUJ8_UNCC3
MRRKKEDKKIKKITENTKIGDLLKESKFEKILTKYRFPCLTCPFAKYELENLTLREVCKIYGISIDDMLKDLNKAAS